VARTHRWARGLTIEGNEAVVPLAIRSTVRFQHGDLLQHPPPRPPYDLILCRNEIIYFEREAQERLMERFIEALRPNGLLVLGRVETLSGASRHALELVHNRERIYRKRG
jgi:chemotaxis protein methyltransferase CheR